MKKFLSVLVVLILLFGAYYLGLNRGGKVVEAPSQPATTTSKASAVEQKAKPTIIGKWQSRTDATFTREFKNDGSAVDLYSDSESSDRKVLGWSIFNSKKPDADFSDNYTPGADYLRLDNGRQSVFYKITKLADSELVLMNMENGTLTEYVKK